MSVELSILEKPIPTNPLLRAAGILGKIILCAVLIFVGIYSLLKLTPLIEGRDFRAAAFAGSALPVVLGLFGFWRMFEVEVLDKRVEKEARASLTEKREKEPTVLASEAICWPTAIGTIRGTLTLVTYSPETGLDTEAHSYCSELEREMFEKLTPAFTTSKTLEELIFYIKSYISQTACNYNLKINAKLTKE